MRHLIFTLLPALLFTFVTSFASSAYALTDEEDIQICLENWKEHPFGSKPKFRVITPKVKVMGIGGHMAEEKATDKPELVLIKSNVNVMSKNVMKLSNPNGWYCLQNKVDVMAKTEINLDCKAKLTASSNQATVLGRDDEQTGVTVMGKTTVNRECGGKSATN
jgi:hypothetical protein